MCKFTTIILLCGAFCIFSTQVSAQNADIEILRTINGSQSNGLRQYSKFMSNNTAVVAVSTPLVMGIAAIIDKNDDLLKSALYTGVSIGVSGVLAYSMKSL